MNDIDTYALGRFIRVRERKDGTHHIFMSVPKHLRPQGWPANIRIPEQAPHYGSLDDLRFYQRAIANARRLNTCLDQRRDRELSLRTARKALPELVEIYFKTLRYRRLGDSRKYRSTRDLVKIVEWSDSRGHPDFATITKVDIEDFLVGFEDRPSTQLQMRSLFNILSKEAIAAGWRADNPVEELPWTAPPLKHPVNLWTLEDVERFAVAARRMEEPGLAALITVQLWAGQRLGDLLACRHGMEFNGERLTLVQSKTSQPVTVPLPKPVCDLIEAARVEGSPYIFTDYETKTRFVKHRLHARFVEVRHAVSREGDPHLVLRTLRHSAICQMVRAGVPLMKIAAVTGHLPQRVHTIIRRYAVDYERFADEAVKQLNRHYGGADSDFYDEKPILNRDFLAARAQRQTYQNPPVDEARPGRFLPAKLGQHRLRWSLPRELSERMYATNDEEPQMLSEST